MCSIQAIQGLDTLLNINYTIITYDCELLAKVVCLTYNYLMYIYTGYKGDRGYSGPQDKWLIHNMI